MDESDNTRRNVGSDSESMPCDDFAGIDEDVQGDIETEVIDPDAPVRYVRLLRGDDELAVIPWDEAQAIARVVQRVEPTNGMSENTNGNDGWESVFAAGPPGFDGESFDRRWGLYERADEEWGTVDQMQKAAEEFSEAAAVLNRAILGQAPPEDVREEIADARMMVEQIEFSLLFEENVVAEFEATINALAERLGDDSEDYS